MAWVGLKGSAQLSASGNPSASAQQQHQQIEVARVVCSWRGAFGLGNSASFMPASAGCSRKLLLKTIKSLHIPSVKKNTLTLKDNDTDSEDEDELDGPIKDMEFWFKQKPPGFGNDKAYDTSLEEKLLQEIERDKIAQAVVMQKMKGKGRVSLKEKKEAIPPPEGIKVWVGNLPRKRNVGRDLRKIFRNVQGLLHIEPIEVGDEKTRHPLCKGFAFLTFANKDDANSFVASWEGKVSIFGKVEKKLTFQFASEEIHDKSKPVSKKNGAILPAGYRLSIKENITTVSLRHALEAAFQSKKPVAKSELQEPQSCTGALRVTGVLPPSNFVDLQIELNADEETDNEQQSCTGALRITGVLPPSSFADLQIELNADEETDNERLGCFVATNETGGLAHQLQEGPIRNPRDCDVGNQDIEIEGYEILDPCLQPTSSPEVSMTLTPQVFTSVETAVFEKNSHGLKKLIAEVSADFREVDPQPEELSSTLRSSFALEIASNGEEGTHTSSSPNQEAVICVDKDKKIHELELKVRDLQNQLQKQAASSQELKSAGSTPSEVKAGKLRSLSSAKSFKAKILQPGSARRLKKKERQVFSKVASKYAV
ncbi:hypothetical protein O6H91_13G016100 [Diphasiastrum complanatum]|uniref:Uncharacterized protein n=1 Tax=Diphasiastrum complanatum TaxID=34168 RepID=A0ACC2BSU9_DIPCM|nr:hypothetical protein O6H91_13G016100 [Diphasiastrum complanatum]